MNKINLLKLGVVLLISPILIKVLNMPILVTLIMLICFFLVVKFNSKLNWLILLFLILMNLQINRLLYLNIHTWKISFDMEQSFLKYPGIIDSINRYRLEGLWIPYILRNIIYNKYLILLPWFSLVMKNLSLLFWIKILGFSGASLMTVGIVSWFKTRDKNYYLLYWFLLIIVTSSLRVLGDSQTAVYLTLPVVICWWYFGFKSKIFEKYSIYWYLLILVDLLLK